MLNKIKILLGLSDTSKDELLTTLIEMASDEAKSYIHSDVLTGLDNTIIEMVIYKYNRLGTEGVESESYSDIDYSYSSDYPDNIVRSLRAHRKVVVL